jgi:phosphomevalonate kinase
MSNYKFRPSSSFAPGKVMLMGEWAVLEVGNPCIVVSIEKGVTVTVEQSTNMSLDAPDVGLCVDLEYHEMLGFSLKNNRTEEVVKTYRFPEKALQIVYDYLIELGHEFVPVHISISSSISSVTFPDGRKTKIGLGSSSATVVAIVKAILLFYGIDVENKSGKDLVFKLSSIAHCMAQKCFGSCYDVAASTYGGALIYKRFDPDWLINLLYRFERRGVFLKEIVQQEWPSLEIKPIGLPKNMKICVGFVGYSGDTRELVQGMEEYKNLDFVGYREKVDLITEHVKRFLRAVEYGNEEEMLKAIWYNEVAITVLEAHSGLHLVTCDLKRLCTVARECGSEAKVSGAGGGDCGIAVCFDEQTAKKTMLEWRKNGILPIAIL